MILLFRMIKNSQKQVKKKDFMNNRLDHFLQLRSVVWLCVVLVFVCVLLFGVV